MIRLEQHEYQVPEDATRNDRHALVIHAKQGRLLSHLIILIHGLTGHRYGYWENMPQFLYEDFPNADLGLYYYKTAWKRIGLFKSIELEDEARVLADELRQLRLYKSVTLVGHSMGGLLAKAAICSLLKRNFRSTIRKISGLVLIASPQLGSLRVPSFLRLLSRDGRALYPHGRLIRDIDTAFATSLNTDHMADPFGKLAIPTWAVVAAEDFWVDALSAGIGIPENQKLTVRGDHSSVKSPTEKHQSSYEFIRDCLDTALRPVKPSEGDNEEIRIDDASIDDVLGIREIAVHFFGDDVTPESILTDFARAGGILRVVKRVLGGEGERRERLSGYFCLIPLSKQIVSEMRAGHIKGADLSMKHVPRETRDTAALYIGAVAARDHYSRAVVLEALRLQAEFSAALGIGDLLTRPVTQDGLRLARKYGFKPVSSSEKLGELFAFDATLRGRSLFRA